MYEDLVRQLRYCCNTDAICEAAGNCPYYRKEEEDGGYYFCTERMIAAAADAIEELSKKYTDSEADNINLTGWFAEERAKHQWISVNERLPEEKFKDVEVLLHDMRRGCENSYAVGTGSLDHRGLWIHNVYDDEEIYELIAWRKPTWPLPEPPKEETCSQ